MYTSGVGLTTTIELYARFVATNTTNPCFTDPTPSTNTQMILPSRIIVIGVEDWVLKLVYAA